MPTIQERQSHDGKISYRVMVRLKGFPVQTATFSRKTDARRWAVQTESAIREGRHFKTTEAKRHTLADLIKRYVKHVLPTKPKSAYKQSIQLKWWSNTIGAYALADVTFTQWVLDEVEECLHDNNGTLCITATIGEGNE